MTGIGGVA